jgi:hypothetical protein
MSYTKYVLNKCFGGFSVSKEVYDELGLAYDGYGHLTGWHGHDWGDDLKLRREPELVAAVEKLGEKANGRHADLKVVSVPDELEIYIDEYDGIESIHEIHRVFG